MTSGVGCTVWADGVAIADGSIGEDPTAPAALSGLLIVWGRETTVDQPEVSTCSLNLIDPPGGQAFTGLLHTGTRLEVTATGVRWPDPEEPTFADGTFEEHDPALVTYGAAAARTSDFSYLGLWSLRVDPLDHERRWSVVIAPAPFAEPGTDPGAWDAIPTTAAGQLWHVSAMVQGPLGSQLRLTPVLFSGPWATSYDVVTDAAVESDGADDWRYLDTRFTPNVAGRWVGLQISGFPTGQAWADLDPRDTWADLAPARSWLEHAAVWIDEVQALAPYAGLTQTVAVFSGRVTNLAASHDGEHPLVHVVAADFTADLDNRDVGDEPWLVEPMGTRFARILELAGTGVDAVIDAPLDQALVSWRDVDRQGATGLLAELAQSVDGVMWAATHQVTGPYLWVEDPAERTSLMVLAAGSDGVVRIATGAAGPGVLHLSACDVLRDEVEWVQDVGDVATRAEIRWLEQGVDEEGEVLVTERTVTQVVPALEDAFGVRRFGLSTQLQSADDAADVAARVLARLSFTGWRATGLVVDDSLTDDTPADVARLLTMLDGTLRHGLPIMLDGLPEWAPVGDRVGVYLEGGTYEFVDGAWVLSLTVSSATGQGGSATWAELDEAWAWVDLDPDISWAALTGVAGPVEAP